jgi:hypothetical protein
VQLPHLGNKGQGIHRHTPDARLSRKTIRAVLDPISERLRAVRVTCGDWSRVLGPSAMWPCATHKRHDVCGVVLDPPYAEGNADYAVGGTGTTLAQDVLEWCVQWSDEPQIRIALCGYTGHYDDVLEPLGWTPVRWKARGGYGSHGDGAARENSAREVVWFSPHCLDEAQGRLF